MFDICWKVDTVSVQSFRRQALQLKREKVLARRELAASSLDIETHVAKDIETEFKKTSVFTSVALAVTEK